MNEKNYNSDALKTIAGVEVLVCEPDGPQIASEQDALDLIGTALGSGAEAVAIPTSRFDKKFFQLKTGLLGQIVQKFVNYRKQLVIYGDLSPYLTDSQAFKDFVYEANRGNQIWFLSDLAKLDERLRK